MTDKVKATIERHHMLAAGETVTVALSGGADSMALLYCLNDLKDEYSLVLKAAHFNHGIRGDEADSDERFVREKCALLGIPFISKKEDVAAIAAERGQGLEECGRDLRYAFLDSVSEGGKIATAHTLSDCEETFLFNLTRGAALRGLTSIPPVRGNIIRPLIECSRDEIEAYCDENSIEFVTDSTNADVTYSRNRIRKKVIPVLKTINPAFDAGFARCLVSLRDDEAFLTDLALSAVNRAKTDLGYKSALLSELAPPVLNRALADIIRSFTGVLPEKHHIDSVTEILFCGGEAQVLKGVRLRCAGGLLYKIPPEAPAWSVDACLGENQVSGFSIYIELFSLDKPDKTQKIAKQLLDNSIDYDKIKGKLRFSSVAEGDKFSLPKRKVTKQLRKLFNEMKIPHELRNAIPVLRDDEGPLWVYGVGVDKRAEISSQTGKCLNLTVRTREEQDV